MGDVTGMKLGRYVIVERLGFGGMGVVYRARDEKLERFVAIKILAPGLLLGDEARRRFRREALALAKLNHAHIAAVYDVGEQDGIDYLVMECVPGESLAAKLAAGPLTVKDATSITAADCAGVGGGARARCDSSRFEAVKCDGDSEGNGEGS